MIRLTQIKISSRQLLRYFNKFLERSPRFPRLKKIKQVYLKIDAKYFGRWGCVLVFKFKNHIVYWFFCRRETRLNWQIAFSRFLELGYRPISVTSDKHGSITSTVADKFPDIPHQFCLVHIQRRCESLITKNPKTKAGRQLKELVSCINRINSHYKKDIFIKWFELYERRWKKYLNQRTYSQDPESKKTWWYTHKNLRKAYIHLKKSLDNMFHYLDDENIPKDTNGLEAEFTHLKQKLNAHRGLTRKRQEEFVNWYFYFKSPYNKN